MSKCLWLLFARRRGPASFLLLGLRLAFLVPLQSVLCYYGASTNGRAPGEKLQSTFASVLQALVISGVGEICARR